MAPKRPNKTDKSGESKKVSFKWTSDVKKKMSSYINEHFTSYKTQKKANFLRAMRDHFEWTQLTDVQLKNGLRSLLAKYQEIKDKLKSSGFGVDPEVDATLDKGWILKECPYFDILDEVLGTRPNVDPPFLIDSGIEQPHEIATVDLGDLQDGDEVGINMKLEDTVDEEEDDINEKIEAPATSDGDELPYDSQVASTSTMN